MLEKLILTILFACLRHIHKPFYSEISSPRALQLQFLTLNRPSTQWVFFSNVGWTLWAFEGSMSWTWTNREHWSLLVLEDWKTKNSLTLSRYTRVLSALQHLPLRERKNIAILTFCSSFQSYRGRLVGRLVDGVGEDRGERKDLRLLPSHNLWCFLLFSFILPEPTGWRKAGDGAERGQKCFRSLRLVVLELQGWKLSLLNTVAAPVGFPKNRGKAGKESSGTVRSLWCWIEALTLLYPEKYRERDW